MSLEIDQSNEVECVYNNEEINNWDELDIDSHLLRGIYSHGFEKPSPIQRKAIRPIIERKDVIAQAQSGTGKTATFTIGALSLVDIKDNTTQILVLSPTRELSKQTANVMNGIGSMMNGLRVQTLVGGTSIDEDSATLRNNVPHVITGCPGRVYDMIRRNCINAKNIKLVILDEADEMLSSGFKEQVYNIFQYLNQNVQVAVFSATLPPSIEPSPVKILETPVVATAPLLEDFLSFSPLVLPPIKTLEASSDDFGFELPEDPKL